MFDRALTTTARYAFAFNQTPARFLLDPLYTAVAKALLAGDIPRSPRLLDRDLPDDLYAGYRARARKLQYFIEDWDFSEARPELLTPRQRAVVHTTTLGETSGMTVSDGFLRAFRTSIELSSFFGTWFVEELNHFRGFHRYAEIMGERWPEARVSRVAEIEFRAYSDDAMEIAACNMYQELLAYLVYRSFSRQVGDPFLAKMVARFAKDELRHYKFYEEVVARRIQQDADFRVTVLKVFLKATTPFNQVSGGVKQTLEHVQNGLFYFRKDEYDYFLDQVEHLLGIRLEGLFETYFSMLAPTCELCSLQSFRCSCEVYEPRAEGRGDASRFSFS
jgi:acyl-[acyl-carrier-protein] desaturase